MQSNCEVLAMRNNTGAVRRVLGIGLAWATLWLALWTIVVVMIGVLDPDSIDPGEGPMVMLSILGPMGLFSGVAFGILLSIADRGRSAVDRSMIRVAAYGILASAIVQLPYLGHGDSGLAANIQMAMLFCAFGGLVTLAWLVMARWSSHQRSSPQSS
jgi:hypothetical protein